MSPFSADSVWDNVAIRAFRGYDEIREALLTTTADTTLDRQREQEVALQARPQH